MKAYFYGTNAINDATSYYVDLVERGIKECGYSFERTENICDIKDANLIFTIAQRDYVRAKIRHPFTKTIFWSQGCAPEEVFSWTFTGIRMWVQEMLIIFFVLHSANVLFLVSERMLQRYRRQFLYMGNNCIVMPCYNMHISNEVTSEKFEEPSFVYAGGCLAWQCVSEMLRVFAMVEKAIPNAKLTILSNNKEKFEEAVKREGILNYEIKYVQKELLDKELNKHKYGFLLRHNSIVNNVATPTKMNSYLSSYLVPIFTDGVDDFRKNIKLGEFSLCFNCPFNEEDVANKIIAFEKSRFNFDVYRKYVKLVFDNHYNDSRYIEHMHKIFLKYL